MINVKIMFCDGSELIVHGCDSYKVNMREMLLTVIKGGRNMFFNFNEILYVGIDEDIS